MPHEGPQLLGKNITESVGYCVGVRGDDLKPLWSNGPQDRIGSPGDEEGICHHLDDNAAGSLGDTVMGLNVA